MRAGAGSARTLACALAAGSLACDEPGPGHVLGVDATATVQGVVYFDRNGNRLLDPSADAPMPGAAVRLRLRATGRAVASAPAASDGTFQIEVPVGEYVLEVDPTTVGDTARVVAIEADGRRFGERDTVPVTLTLGAADAAEAIVGVSYPKLFVAELRAAAEGTKAFVEGVALNHVDTFGDTTVHLADATGSVRVTRVRGVVFLGDSVRFLGTRRARTGQPVLEEGLPFFLGIGTPPPPEPTGTAAAASADGGRLDAALVEVPHATVTDTASGPGGLRATLDDGSGPLRAFLDADLGFDPAAVAPGTEVRARGLLVPTGTGVWELRPRAPADLGTP